MKFNLYTVATISIFLVCCDSKTIQNTEPEKTTTNSVQIVGEMRNVMHKGELFGTIDLDTISNKQHIYGLGPVEFLTGEILLIDGKGYKSIVVNDTTMEVTETFAMKAPFFVYANVDHWTETDLPDSVVTMKQLEKYLDQITKESARPFCFRLSLTVDTASIHIVNLPAGAKVSSPEEAHRGQKNFPVRNQHAEVVGFFSTEHQGVFTHHDSYIHMHLITQDKKSMGHVDQLHIKPGTASVFTPRIK